MKARIVLILRSWLADTVRYSAWSLFLVAVRGDEEVRISIWLSSSSGWSSSTELGSQSCVPSSSCCAGGCDLLA